MKISEADTMKDTTHHIEVNGETYLMMNKRLFDLRIKLAYTNGQIDAYRKVEELKESGVD